MPNLTLAKRIALSASLEADLRVLGPSGRALVRLARSAANPPRIVSAQALRRQD
jgi:hypothetical protein